MNKTKVGIIGATGYAGSELARLLYSHPYVELKAISSVSYIGKKISEVYPSFNAINDCVLVDEDTVIDSCDVVFASLPHGLAEKIARKCYDKGVKLIDLGADFRLTNDKDYTQWYGLEYNDKELHKHAVYCIPELHRERVKGAEIIGNPGCYPTSISLALAPLLKIGAIDIATIIIDSKSGVTGAGRGLTQTTHYPDCNEAFSPYKIAAHRHTPEIEEVLSDIAGEKLRVTFVPHLLPVNRGIVSTIYANISTDFDISRIKTEYRKFYENEKFVRVLADGEVSNLKNVKYSNYCDISLHFDERTNRIIVVSAIDNMVKGAAGQAIQNMNILLGFDEASGLDFVPPSF